MSTYTYGPALESEIGYRRSTLLHDAETGRLVREARLATRAARAAKRVANRRPTVTKQDTVRAA